MVVKKPSRSGRLVPFAVVSLVVLVFVALAVWRAQKAYDVKLRLATLRTAGVPTNGDELNQWYIAVPDTEDAALLMAQAFELLRSYPDSRSNEMANLMIPTSGLSLTAERRQLFTGYVEMNTEALDKAHETFALTNSRYPVDYSAGIYVRLPHLAPLHRLAQLAAYEAWFAAEAGQTAKSCRDIETALGCGKSLESEPDLVAQLVRIAILAYSSSALERCLAANPFKEDELIRLATALSAAEKTNLMARALVGDRAMNLPSFLSIAEGRRRRTKVKTKSRSG